MTQRMMVLVLVGLVLALVPGAVAARPVAKEGHDQVAMLFEALNRGNVDHAMRFFGDNALVKEVNPRTGKAELHRSTVAVRRWLMNLVAQDVKLSITEMGAPSETRMTFSYRIALTSHGLKGKMLPGTGEIELRYGQILRMTWGLTPEAMAQVQSAQTAAAEPAQPAAQPAPAGGGAVPVRAAPDRPAAQPAPAEAGTAMAEPQRFAPLGRGWLLLPGMGALALGLLWQRRQHP